MIDEGGIGAIFAYGQTGSGKTYTMHGLAERLVHSLPFHTHEVTIRLLEVLGDHVKDLGNGEPLRVVVDHKRKVVTQGKTLFSEVKTAEEALECIQSGFAKRRMMGTLKNNTSSRTHFICQITMTHRDTMATSEVKIVDLAGSERHADSKFHDAERIQQAADINTDLMALKECIRFRTKLNSTGRVPYRSSKLTMLLKGISH
jgi:kinesin family protein 2/24